MDVRAILMGLAFAFMWSSAFTSARIIVADAPPILALALRFLLSGVIGIGIARALGQSWQLTRRQWMVVVVFGLCQNTLYLGLNFYAMQTVEASLAAIIASTMPLLVALGSWLILREPLPLPGVIGLLAGVAGVVLIMGSRVSGGDADSFALILCGIGAMALAAATMLLRGASSGGNFMMIVGMQMLVGCAPLALIGALTESPAFTPSWPLLIAFAYTLFFPGLIATLVWFHLVHRIGPTKAASFHFLNPFMGIAVAALILGEKLGWLDIVGVAVITIGIIMVQRSRTPATRAPDNRVRAPAD